MKADEAKHYSYVDEDGTEHFGFNASVMQSLIKGLPVFLPDGDGNYRKVIPGVTILSFKGVINPKTSFTLSEEKYTYYEAKKIVEYYVKKLKGGDKEDGTDKHP